MCPCPQTPWWPAHFLVPKLGNRVKLSVVLDDSGGPLTTHVFEALFILEFSVLQCVYFCLSCAQPGGLCQDCLARHSGAGCHTLLQVRYHIRGTIFLNSQTLEVQSFAQTDTREQQLARPTVPVPRQRGWCDWHVRIFPTSALL
jgi:hypothetical protein